jgi:hypothetical protein
MVRSAFKAPHGIIVVAGQQLHQQPADFHRSPDDGANETSSDYYFYKQVAYPSLIRCMVCVHYIIIGRYYFNGVGREK